jgi:hypothetical protein
MRYQAAKKKLIIIIKSQNEKKKYAKLINFIDFFSPFLEN